MLPVDRLVVIKMLVIAEKLKMLRRENNILQRQMADMLQIKERMYRHYEAGDVDLPISKMLVIADFFNVSLEYLIGREKTNKAVFSIQAQAALTSNVLSLDAKVVYLNFCNIASDGKVKILSTDDFCLKYFIEQKSFENSVTELLDYGYIKSKEGFKENNVNIFTLEENVAELNNIMVKYQGVTIRDAYIESEEQYLKKISNELDNVGISPKAIGRKYLIDAILLTIIKPNQNKNVCAIIAKKYNKSILSTERAMQNAILSAWRYEDSYTARVSNITAAPTLTEFIYFYANKIKNDY